MSSYKLVYFNSRGRAEVIRLILAVAEQNFEDCRLSNEEWPEHKQSGKAPFGQLPYLVIKNGPEEITIAQTLAITSYLGKKLGLFGQTELEHVECEMYTQQISDLFAEFTKVFFENDETKKAELLVVFTEELVPRNLAFMEAKLKKTHSGFLIGSAVTVADLYLFVGFETLTNGGFKTTDVDKVASNFPMLLRHFQRIKAMPQVAAWLAKRPQTEF